MVLGLVSFIDSYNVFDPLASHAYDVVHSIFCVGWPWYTTCRGLLLYRTFASPPQREVVKWRKNSVRMVSLG